MSAVSTLFANKKDIHLLTACVHCHIMLQCVVAAVLCMITSACAGHEDDKGNGSESLKKELSRADSLYSLGEYPEALRQLKSFTSLHNPPTADTAHLIKAYTLLADIHSKYEDYSGQREFLSAAVRLYPRGATEAPGIYARLVDCSCRLGDRDEAMRALSALRSEPPGVQGIRFHLLYAEGVFDYTFRSPQKALRELKEAREETKMFKPREAESVNLMLRLARTYLKLENPDSALRYLEEIEHRIPALQHCQRRELLQAAASANVLAGDSVKALQYTRRWIEHDDTACNPVEFLSVNSSLNHEHADRRHAVMDILRSDLGLWKGVLTALIAVVLFALGWELTRMQRHRRKAATVVDDCTPAAEELAMNETLDRIYRLTVAELSKPENFMRSDYNLNLLAAEIGANVSYVSKAINRGSGKNFRALLNEYRIREACRRLDDTGSYGHLTLQAIAESVGFASASSFIRAFRKTTGTTPSSYKKRETEA